MNSSKSHLVQVQATCKHCGSKLQTDSLTTEDKDYAKLALRQTRNLFRRLFPNRKVVRVEATLI